ncbi:MAG: TraR/DksA C4-type zinc finger protein [Isosphaeraceae bacterium]
MTGEKLEAFRTQLMELSRRLRGDLATLDEQVGTPTGGDAGGNLSNTPLHMADLGTAVYMQELDATLRENQEYLREQVLTAIQRLDSGSFGQCERCGRPILEERLELLPYTPYCTACSVEVQAGKSVNLNDGRPQRPEETLDPADDDVADELDPAPSQPDGVVTETRDPEILFTDLEPDAAPGAAAGDVHAAGTAGGGTAVGGLAGTNIGSGEPDEEDLNSAMGSGDFDVGIEADDADDIPYSGPTGGAVGGTPAGKRSVGGKKRKGLAPQTGSGDSPAGP